MKVEIALFLQQQKCVTYKYLIDDGALVFVSEFMIYVHGYVVFFSQMNVQLYRQHNS